MGEPDDDRDQDRLERLSLELERNRLEVERLTLLANVARERMVEACQRMRELQRQAAETIDRLPRRENGAEAHVPGK